jgi:hypothetical protein
VSKNVRRVLIVVGVALVCAAVVGAVLVRQDRSPVPLVVPPGYWMEDPATTTTHLQEDDPGWDCRTMGNRECGSGDVAR